MKRKCSCLKVSCQISLKLKINISLYSFSDKTFLLLTDKKLKSSLHSLLVAKMFKLRRKLTVCVL